MTNGTTSGFHCVNDGDQSQENYRLHDNWIRVTISELKKGPGGLGDEFGNVPGRELDSHRWDGLDCFKGYTVLITADHQLQLYDCANCRKFEMLRGREPLQPSS